MNELDNQPGTIENDLQQSSIPNTPPNLEKSEQGTYPTQRTLLLPLGLIIIIIVAILGYFWLVSDESETDAAVTVAEQTTLKTSGSGSTTALLAAVQAKFESDTPGYRLEVISGTGSGSGVKGIIAGVLDVAAMARPLKDEEIAQDIEFVQFARSSKAIIVHADVEVRDLTSSQITRIFSGEVTNWSDLNGPDQAIILYIRDEGDSNITSLRQNVIGDIPLSTDGVLQNSPSEMLIAVEGTPGGIGIATWPTATETSVKAVAVDGLAPDDSDYPMVGVIGIGWLADNKAVVQPLIDWLLSERGQAALRDAR